MSTTHVYFADMPLAAANREGHSPLAALNDDVIHQCRSISPNCSNSPIPRYERNMGFFRQLSRRFGLRSNDDLVFTGSNEDDNQSSSTDSCSSHTPLSAATANATLLSADNKKKDSNLLLSTATTEYVSCASSETSSTVDIEEQLQQLQLQQQKQQQQQLNVGNANNSANNYDEKADSLVDGDDAISDNNENSNDAVKPAYNKERKSFARSSFSRLHRRSTTSIRRAFEAFSLSSRSLSCSGVTPPPILPTSSSSSSSTNNGTPIKSALKSSSNLELNKKSLTTTSCPKKPSCSSSSFSATGKPTTASSSASSSKTKTKPPPQRILRQPVSYTYLKGISGLPTQRVPRNSVCCQYARR